MEWQKGLDSNEVAKRQQQYGKNSFHIEKTHMAWHTMLTIIKEPMFLMLVSACLLYFLLKEYEEATIFINS